LRVPAGRFFLVSYHNMRHAPLGIAPFDLQLKIVSDDARFVSVLAGWRRQQVAFVDASGEAKIASLDRACGDCQVEHLAAPVDGPHARTISLG
jgi:hypothetical protein